MFINRETITVSHSFLFISRFNVWKTNYRQIVKFDSICSLNFYPNTHSLTVSCSSTLFLHFFSVFPPSSQSPSSFNSLFSLSPRDFFDILWIMLWAILCGFSQDLFSIFFACFHLIRRCYQPPTSQYFECFSSIFSSQFPCLSFYYFCNVSIFNNTPIFVFHNLSNEFFFPPTNVITNYSFLSL